MIVFGNVYVIVIIYKIVANNPAERDAGNYNQKYDNNT